MPCVAKRLRTQLDTIRFDGALGHAAPSITDSRQTARPLSTRLGERPESRLALRKPRACMGVPNTREADERDQCAWRTPT
jgi:hypothetical protein